VSGTTEAREERAERDTTAHLHHVNPSTLNPTAMKCATVEKEEKVDTTVVTTEAREARDTTDAKPSAKSRSAMMSGSPTEEKEVREAKEEREPDPTTTDTDTTSATDMIADTSMDLTTETLKPKTLSKNKIANWPPTLLIQAQVSLSIQATTDTATMEEKEEREEKDPRGDAAKETLVHAVTGRLFANLSSPFTPHLPLTSLLHKEKEVREERVDPTMASTTEERAARDITHRRLSTLILSTLILTAMKYATDMAEKEEREVSTMEATTEERAERVPGKFAKSFAILSTHPNTLPSVTLLLTAMATTAVLLQTHASAERAERAPDVVTTEEREEKDTDTTAEREEKDTDTTDTAPDTTPNTDTQVLTRYKYSPFPVIVKSWCDKIVPKRMLV